jgi:hypothetical protein
MEPLTPEFQKLLELIAMLGGVSTLGVLALIVRIFVEGWKKKKNSEGNPGSVTAILLQQQSETLKSLATNLTTMVALDAQQANILASIATGIQELKIDTTSLPAMGKQLQEIQTCLAVVKDRLKDGG